MKKFLTILAVALGMFAMQSCNTNDGIVYSVTAYGDANGNLSMVFPNGNLELNGKSDIDFVWDNDKDEVIAAVDTTTFGVGEGVYGLDEAIAADDAKLKEQANAVNDWLANTFEVNSAEGDYYVHIVGYAKEKVTGFTLAIDRVFTNRVQPIDSTDVQ